MQTKQHFSVFFSQFLPVCGSVQWPLKGRRTGESDGHIDLISAPHDMKETY